MILPNPHEETLAQTCWFDFCDSPASHERNGTPQFEAPMTDTAIRVENLGQERFGEGDFR